MTEPGDNDRSRCTVTEQEVDDGPVRPCQSWGLVIEQGDDGRAGGQ